MSWPRVQLGCRCQLSLPPQHAQNETGRVCQVKLQCKQTWFATVSWPGELSWPRVELGGQCLRSAPLQLVYKSENEMERVSQVVRPTPTTQLNSRIRHFTVPAQVRPRFCFALNLHFGNLVPFHSMLMYKSTRVWAQTPTAHRIPIPRQFARQLPVAPKGRLNCNSTFDTRSVSFCASPQGAGLRHRPPS